MSLPVGKLIAIGSAEDKGSGENGNAHQRQSEFF